MRRRTAATTSRSASGRRPIDGPGFDLAAVIAATCAGLEDGRQATGLPCGLVVCLLRHDEDETNLAVARAAAAAAGRGVVGLDVAGDELRFPSNAPYEAPFAIAAAAGLGLTAHAAEAGPASAVHRGRRAVRRPAHRPRRRGRDRPGGPGLGSRAWRDLRGLPHLQRADRCGTRDRRPPVPRVPGGGLRHRPGRRRPGHDRQPAVGRGALDGRRRRSRRAIELQAIQRTACEVGFMDDGVAGRAPGNASR